MELRLDHAGLLFDSPCCVCRSQFVVEGDVTFPGSLRETTNVLYAAATAVAERTEAFEGRVSVSGKAVFCVLYTQGDKSEVESIEASADFTHLCELADVQAQADVEVFLQTEHAEARVHNGRMNMRAVVKLCAKAVNRLEMTAVNAVAVPDARMKTVQVKARRRVGWGSGEVLMREEFALPADLALRDALGAFASVEFQDAAGGQGRVGLAGELNLDVIHASDIPGKPLAVTHHTVPVSQSVELRGENGDWLGGRIVVKDVAVASQDAGDGERTLRAEILLGLSAWSEKAEEHTLLEDAYTTSGDDLKLSRKTASIRTGAMQVSAAESGRASLLLPEGAKPIRTMLAAFVNPVLSSIIPQGGRTVAEGVLETTLLYMTDGQPGPASVQLEAPFRAVLAMQVQPEDVLTLSAVGAEAVPVTTDRAELRYVLKACAEGNEKRDISLVADAAAVPAAQTTQDIVLYYPQPGEDAWDIAKRYRVPEDELQLLNPGLEEIKPGKGVVVWRRKTV